MDKENTSHKFEQEENVEDKIQKTYEEMEENEQEEENLVDEEKDSNKMYTESEVSTD